MQKEGSGEGERHAKKESEKDPRERGRRTPPPPTDSLGALKKCMFQAGSKLGRRTKCLLQLGSKLKPRIAGAPGKTSESRKKATKGNRETHKDTERDTSNIYRQ